MAARKRPQQNETCREKIRTTQLLKRLQDHIFTPDKVQLSQTQLKAIEICLRKALPDLQSVEHVGEDAITYVIAAPVQAANVETWLETAMPSQTRQDGATRQEGASAKPDPSKLN